MVRRPALWLAALALLVVGLNGLISAAAIGRIGRDSVWVMHSRSLLHDLDLLAIGADDGILLATRAEIEQDPTASARDWRLFATATAQRQRRVRMLERRADLRALPSGAMAALVASTTVYDRDQRALLVALAGRHYRAAADGGRRLIGDTYSVRAAITTIQHAQQTLLVGQEQDERRHQTQALLASAIAAALDVTLLAVTYLVAARAARLRRAVAEERVAAAHAESERLREQKAYMDELLSLVGHELNTPLTAFMFAVQLTTEMFKRRDAGDPRFAGEAAVAKVRTKLDMMYGQAQRMQRLVGDLLDLSRIESGSLSFSAQRYDLAAQVATLVAERQTLHPERTILLEVPETPQLVDGDSQRVGQVLLNYLTNAYKYTPAATPVTVSLRQTGAVLTVAVRDEGPGLTPEQAARVWQKLYRVEGTDAANGARLGLGLGLYVARSLIERQGGSVGVESAPGAGCTFWFSLPAVPAPLPVPL